MNKKELKEYHIGVAIEWCKNQAKARSMTIQETYYEGGEEWIKLMIPTPPPSGRGAPKKVYYKINSSGQVFNMKTKNLRYDAATGEEFQEEARFTPR